MKSRSAQWPSQVSLFAFTCFLVACGSSAPIVLPTRNPLVAEYSVPTGQKGALSVDFGTDTAYGRQTASYPVLPGVTSVLVAGMKPSITYHMRAKITSAGSVVWSDQDRTFTTGSLPIPAPTTIVTRTPASALQATENPGVELVTFSPPPNTNVLEGFVTDRDGNPIWYYDPPGTVGFLKPMPNGHMLVDLNTVNGENLIREIDLAGKTIRELPAQTLQQALLNIGQSWNVQSFSHDFVPLDNGHVIVLIQLAKDFTDLSGYPAGTTTTVLGDALVDLDQNWNPVWAWSAFDHLDINRRPMSFPDWTHGNAVLYNSDDGNLLLSLRHQHWVIDIDYQNGGGSGDILWKLGYQGDFTLTNSTDSDDWFFAQHFPSFVNRNGPQMTLALFDNGDNRADDNQGTVCDAPNAPACYSRATIFQLDHSTMQAQILWQNLPGFYSFWGGAINELQNGNVEFEMSEPFPLPTLGSRVMEVTQSNEAVWQMDLLNGFSYRTYRIPSLYPGVTWP